MSEKSVGVYAADVIPGVYTKTLTGIERGVELYSRPDVKRPWRSSNKQKTCQEIALREKEIESLLKLCSQLRCKLGNVEHDRNVMEYTTEELSKVNVKAKNNIINELTMEIEELNRKLHDSEEKVQDHIRLLNSEHENEVNKYVSEIRVANENYMASKKMYEQQIDDIKRTCSREITLMESRIESRVQEVNTELAASRKNCELIRELYESEKSNYELTLKKIETDNNKRVALAEERICTLQQTHEMQLLEERKCNIKYLEEIHKLSMEVSLLKAERNEYIERNASWCRHLLTSLDSCFHCITKTFEEFNGAQFSPEAFTEILKSVTTSTNASTQEELNLYVPKILLDEFDNKNVMERILCRISEIEVLSKQLTKQASYAEHNNNCGGDSDGTSTALHMELKNVTTRQRRLCKILEEVTKRQAAMEKCCKIFAQQAIFFSDNLCDKNSTNVNLLPPLPSQQPFFVGLRILNARKLWTETPEQTRLLLSLFYTTLRCSMLTYGGYECYFTDTLMIWAFNKPIDAALFCAKLIEWYIECQICSLINTHVEASHLSTSNKQEDALKVMLKMCELQFTLTIHCGESYVESGACVHPCMSKYVNNHKETTADSNAEESVYFLSKQNLHYYGPCLTQLLDLMRTNTHINSILLSGEAWHLWEMWKECNMNDVIVTQTLNVQTSNYSIDPNEHTKTTVTNYRMTTKSIEEKLQLLKKMYTNKSTVYDSISSVAGKIYNTNVNNSDNSDRRFTKDEISKDNTKYNDINGFSELSKVDNLNNLQIILETLEDGITDENLEDLETTMLFTEALETIKSIHLLSDAIEALKAEANFVSDQATTLLAKTRESKEHFLLLSPSEMTAQMNDLFTISNKVASRVEGVCAEITTLSDIHKRSSEKQNDLNNSIKKIMSTMSDRVELQRQMDELRVEYEQIFDKMVSEHKVEVERLNEALHERNNLLQRLAYVTIKNDVKPELKSNKKSEKTTKLKHEEQLELLEGKVLNVKSKHEQSYEYTEAHIHTQNSYNNNSSQHITSM